MREDFTISDYDRTYYHTVDSSAYETAFTGRFVGLSLVLVNTIDCVCARVFPGEEISAATAAAVVSTGMRFYCRPVGTLSSNYQRRIRAVLFVQFFLRESE